MTTYASLLRDKKNQLIRKARDGSVYIAPYAAPAITSLTTGASADLQALPGTGANVYTDLGWTSTDGVTYGRATDTSAVQSFGSVEPTREDVTKDTITMQATAQETKLLTIGLTTGADTTGLQAAFQSGEFQVAKPAKPAFRYYRALGLFVDTDDNGLEIYFGRFMPRARITELAEQKYTDGDNPIEYGMTFTGFEDSVLGYSHKWIWGGPGWKALLTDMKIPQATS